MCLRNEEAAGVYTHHIWLPDHIGVGFLCVYFSRCINRSTVAALDSG